MATPVSFAVKPTLSGELVRLRPVHEADATGLASVHADTLRLTGTHRTFDLSELRSWYRTRADHDDRLDLAIIERATGEWVGEVVLNDLDVANRSCGFRILIATPDRFGRGFGTEATRLVLGHAFDTVGLNRVELEVYDFNPRARHVYEKVGFVHEGTKRQALWWDGQWIDAHMMAMLAGEWAAAR
ncbi:MAG TPA: GNAT family protein [Jatrophihabitantaceae bacterium]|jgi:RimJ/RimL family protein N-acetyltransferase|nr:GNAT family protein [Jatrophihabitantaceae bacterium]